MRISARRTHIDTLATRSTRLAATALICGLVLGPSVPARGQGPSSANAPGGTQGSGKLGPIETVGSEFQVNTYTTDDQRRPAVAQAPDGRFVVVWEDLRSGDWNVWAQLYASDGSAVSGEFLVNGYTSGSQQEPAVTMTPSGSFVVVWEGSGPTDSSGIHGRLFFSDGTPNGSDLVVNTGTTTFFQREPSIASDDDGDFVVVWRSGAVTAAQRFASDGSGFGEFVAHADLDDFHPEVAMNNVGNFVVVWEAATKGMGYPIEGLRFDASGSALGAAFQVNIGGDYNYQPTVGLADSGSFVVAWATGEKGGNYDILARRFDSSGSPVAGELQVNTTSVSYYSFSPNLGMKPNGDFAVVWQSYGMALPRALAQRFASDATPIGTEFAVTSSTAAQFGSTLALDEHNAFVVAWQSGDAKYGGDDGDESGIFARRFNFCDDSDFDGVCNVDDICEGGDDSVDTDMDGTPDGCDLCALGDDSVDTDMDGVPDACDICALGDDGVDSDSDTVPDACDVCPGGDDTVDTDMDDIPDDCDDFVPPVVSSVSASTVEGAVDLDGCRELRATTTGLAITFSEAMDPGLAVAPSSFRLIAADGDHDIDTLTCGAVSPNDRLVPLSSIDYDEGTFTTTIEATIVEELHRILVCGTVQDEQGNAMGPDFRTFFRVDSTNLFDNGHFDCFLSDWNEQGSGIGADTFDFHGSELSGSAAFNVTEGASQSISQCVEVAPGGLATTTEMDLHTGVFVSAKAERDTVQVRRGCELFPAANCAGEALGQVSTADQIVIDTEGAFLAFNDPMIFTAATVSARCSFEFIGITGDPIALFDEIIMRLPSSLADAIFTDGFESGDTSSWSETAFTHLSLAPTEEPP